MEKGEHNWGVSDLTLYMGSPRVNGYLRTYYPSYAILDATEFAEMGLKASGRLPLFLS